MLSGGTLALVAVDKPFRGDNDETDKQVLPGPPTHTVATKTTVRCESATTSKAVGTMYPGQHVCVLETVEEDGHQRARIGAARWISQTTAAGNSLLVRFAPDTPMYAVVKINDVDKTIVRRGASVESAP